MKLQGLDHIDVRVRSLREVEAFYDALLPALGLSRKSEGHVADDGEWYGVGNDRSRNAIEYATPVVPGMRGWFVGFIEEPSTVANGTRIAFAIEDKGALPMIEPLVRQAGGASSSGRRKRTIRRSSSRIRAGRGSRSAPVSRRAASTEAPTRRKPLKANRGRDRITRFWAASGPLPLPAAVGRRQRRCPERVPFDDRL